MSLNKEARTSNIETILNHVLAPKKKLLVSLQIAMGVRNFLCSKVFEELGKDWEILILTPFANDETFRKNFSSPNYKLTAVRPQGFRGPWGKWLYQLEYFELWRRFQPGTTLKFIERLRSDSPLKYLFRKVFLGAFGSWLGQDRNLLKDLVYSVEFPQEWGQVDAVLVLTTDHILDRKIWYTAKKTGIPLIAMPHSWDNLPGRGLFPASCDKLLVWNQTMADQGIQYHGMKRSDVSIVGIPQYQLYRDVGIDDRETYLKSIGLSPDRQYVVYTCNSKMVLPDEEVFIETLLRDYFSRHPELTLILRTHPQDRASLYKTKYAEHSQVLLDFANGLFSADVDIPTKDTAAIKGFNNLMAHAVCVVQYYSTTAIDAAFWKTPSITPSFNTSYSTSEWNSAHRWAETNHYSPIIKQDMVTVANSFQEIFQFIDHCLAARSDFAEKTNRLAINQIPSVDSSQAMRQALGEFLK